METLENWLKILRCPLDGAILRRNKGGLQCIQCRRTYPILHGVVSFVVPAVAEQHQNEEWRQKRQEMRARDQQSARYDRLLGLRLFSTIEVHKTLRALRCETNRFDSLVEVGCGTGRMLQHFARIADWVIGIDFSLESLRRCQHRMQQVGAAHRTLLLHADACFLPLADEVFSAVASCQLIEHLPTTRLRQKAVSEMERVLTKGGRYAISGYRWSWIMGGVGRKEGYHKGGIYYYRFTRAEFATLLASRLPVGKVESVLGYLWLASGQKEP